MERLTLEPTELKYPKRRANDCYAFAASASCADGQPSCSTEDSPICWICLDGPRPEACLQQPCGCPRFAHAHCLARWQLQSAGSRKETHCEFCDGQLPDWKYALTPKCGANAPAVMNVNFDGRIYSFDVKPGAEGYRHFTEAIRRAFALPDDSELNITFTCDEPSPGPFVETPVALPGLTHMGSLLTLQGAGAYDAAVHCASVSAARRILQQGMPGPSFPPPPGQPSSAGSSTDSRRRPQQAGQEDPRVGEKRRFRIASKLRTSILDLVQGNRSNSSSQQ